MWLLNFACPQVLGLRFADKQHTNCVSITIYGPKHVVEAKFEETIVSCHDLFTLGPTHMCCWAL